MPFDIPALPKLIKRVRGDLTPASNSGALRRSDGEVISRTQSGAVAGLYGHQAYIADQILPDTCSEETLLRLAAMRLPNNGRRPAVAAMGPLVCSGRDTARIEAGELWQTRDGRRYTVKLAGAISGSTATVTLAAVDEGVLGNLDEGTELTSVSPIEGVSDKAYVGEGGISGGTDIESIESLRARVVRTYRVVPRGGKPDDYVTWALEVPGITRAWCVRNFLGAGTVGVYIMRDGDADPFPTEEQCDVVAAYIEAQRPTCPEVYVMAPKNRPVPMTIDLTPDTAEMRVAVTAALDEVFRAEADLGVTLIRSHLTAAISGAPGEDDHKLLVPAENVECAVNELPTPGVITWV
ncbi:baseplate J/gp47 family protein [Pandoraea pnomenusa]|uniref:baseplate J/gp47 family protein n=1 Tax=Pandoraea pnomenusa TaxID=93220 RepID=UPI001ACE83F0|nr:baseplate J/gp47 family protein [Pandoraea pnomenusa]MBN9093018.1 baseplate J/gp47 family protein [Pandoraea pnomenusa]